MTKQQKPEALHPITRYEVVDCIDSKHVPAVIPNGAGPWVRYEDHVAALVEAQQHALSVVAMSPINRLIAYSAATTLRGLGYQWDEAAEAWKLAPTPQADSAQEAPIAMQSLTAALKADPEYAWAWHCNLAMPIMDNAKVSHRVANITAAQLMQHLFGIDTEKHPHFEVADEAPQADSQPVPVPVPVPVLDRARIREIFMAHGFTVKEGQTDLKQYVYDAADAMLRAARAPADSVTAPAYSIDADPQGIRARVAEAITGAMAFGVQGANPPPPGHWLAPFWESARWESIRAKPVHPSADTLYLLRRLLSNQHTLTGSEFRAELGKIVEDAHAPTPPAQAADSVLEDAARWRELREQHESDEALCCVFAPNDMRECLVPVGSLPGELDAFMDSERAARKQGANRD